MSSSTASDVAVNADRVNPPVHVANDNGISVNSNAGCTRKRVNGQAKNADRNDYLIASKR